MSAENIANVVADLNGGQVIDCLTNDADTFGLARNFWAREPVTVIDATAIYQTLVRDMPQELNYYDDYPSIAPPWASFAICYQNQHGNVTVMHSTALDRVAAESADEWLSIERWDTTNEVDWGRVRWTLHTWIWMGGYAGDGTPAPTHGPRHMWQTAVYADGTAADHHWLHLMPEYPMAAFDMAFLVFLQSLNFLACRNVEIVEPSRPAAERRRIERTGVRVHTINVFPAGKTTRSTKGDPVGGVPLHPVRGHLAHYGDCCPGIHPERGRLFGKLEGKYWIPPHARGNAVHGESAPDYKLVPEGETR